MMQKQRASRRSKDRRRRAVFAIAAAAAGKFIWGSCITRWTTGFFAQSACRNMQSRIFSAASVRHASGVDGMTLLELSAQYEKSAQLLRVRLSELRRQKKTAEDRQELFWLDRRMAALSQMLRQTNELAALTAHYYERGYYRNESYRI